MNQSDKLAVRRAEIALQIVSKIEAPKDGITAEEYIRRAIREELRRRKLA